MSEFKDDIEELRVAMLRLRPKVRPYYLAGIWILTLFSIAWRLKMYLGGHPDGFGNPAPVYSIVFGFLLFDYLVERRLRRKKEDSDRGE